MGTLAVVAAIYAVLVVATWYSRFSKVASLAFRTPMLRAIDGATLPEEYFRFFRAASVPLEKRGFRPVGVLKQRSFEVDGGEIYIALLFNEEQSTYAWLHNNVCAHENDPAIARLFSYLDDGAIVVTDNEYVPVRIIPNQQLLEFSIASDNIDELLEAHAGNVGNYQAARGAGVKALTPQQAILAYNEAWETALRNALDHKLVSGSEASFFLGLKLANTLAGAFRKREKLRHQAIARRLSNPDPDPSALSAHVPPDVLARPQRDMARMVIESLQSPTTRPVMPWITFALSGALFCLFFGLWLGWELVPVLLGVILLHELGHYLAMRVSGYSQTSIFFVPGLGAAAAGNAGTANYWQRLFVYYAGPLPGIILGFGLWLAFPGASGLLAGFVGVLLFLNWFNLLPFMPLDGGQAINLCLGERSRFGFACFSAMGLLALAFFMSEPILWVIGAFAVFSALARWGVLGLRVTLHELARDSGSEDEFYANALRAMQAPAHRQLNFSARVGLLREFLEELHMPRVNALQKIAGFIIYIISFSLPVILLASISLSNFDTDHVPPERDWQRELSAATGAEDALEVALEATGYYLDHYDTGEAAVYLARAEEQFSRVSTPAEYASELEAYWLMMRLLDSAEEDNGDDISRQIRSYLAAGPQPDETYYNALKLGLQRLGPSEEQFAGDILALLEEYLAPLDRRSEMAELYLNHAYLLEDSADRVAWAERALDASSGIEKNTYRDSLARVYMDDRQFDKAIGLLDRSRLDGEEHFAYEQYAWAAYRTGAYALALELYEHQLEASEDLGGWGLLGLLVGEESFELARFQVYLGQLIVADKMGDREAIGKAASAIQAITEDEDNAEWVTDSMRQMKKALRHQDGGWWTDQSREKIKVYERYFGGL